MTDPGREMREEHGLTRRAFLLDGVRTRLAAVLGGGVAAPEITMAEGTERPDPPGTFAPDDLRPLTRDAVMAAIGRLRAQRRTP